jgi:hypothetical protein
MTVLAEAIGGADLVTKTDMQTALRDLPATHC